MTYVYVKGVESQRSIKYEIFVVDIISDTPCNTSDPNPEFIAAADQAVRGMYSRAGGFGLSGWKIVAASMVQPGQKYQDIDSLLNRYIPSGPNEYHYVMQAHLVPAKKQLSLI